MGRNIDGLDLSASEKSELAYEWTISDFMEDEKDKLERKLKNGIISRDEYMDAMENLRESAEEHYRMSFAEEETFGVPESDWDYMQECMEAF